MSRESFSMEAFGAYLNQRLDDLEELLRISVVQRVIEDAQGAEDTAWLQARPQGRALLAELEECGLTCTKVFSFGGATCLMLTAEGQLTISWIRALNAWMAENYPDHIPVYCFQRINGALKKRLREENISFCLEGRELHVVRP